MSSTSFSYNWNNKLNCNAFTTLRLWQPDKYIPGEIHKIFLLNKSSNVDKQLGEAAVIEVRRIKLEQINNYIGFLDTGYSAEETKELLKTMYKNKHIDWRTQELALVLFKRVTIEKQTELFKN